MVAKVPMLALRGAQFFFTLLIMSLVGNMISLAVGGNPSIVNFDMFVAVFSMLTLIYHIAVAFNDGISGHPALPAALDGINMLLFLIAGIATAAYLHVGQCSNQDYRDNNLVTNGSWDNFKRCQEAQASTAFIWFNFALYTASLVFTAGGASGSGINMRGGIRRGPAPTMSQV